MPVPVAVFGWKSDAGGGVDTAPTVMETAGPFAALAKRKAEEGDAPAATTAQAAPAAATPAAATGTTAAGAPPCRQKRCWWPSWPQCRQKKTRQPLLPHW